MTKLICICTIACATLVACGGGPGGSGLKKNDYLGTLPALYADQAAGLEAIEQKANAQAEKLMAGGEGNHDKIQPLYDKATEQMEQLKTQLRSDVEAQIAKLDGGRIPVTFSEALRSSGMDFYEISGMKITGERNGSSIVPSIVFDIIAKNDFTVPGMQSYDWSVYYRLTKADGVVDRSTSVLLPIPLERSSRSFTAGTQLLSGARIPLNFSSNAAELADFTGIEFISKSEYNNR